MEQSQAYRQYVEAEEQIVVLDVFMQAHKQHFKGVLELFEQQKYAKEVRERWKDVI